MDSIRRHPERGRTDRAELDALLDEVLFGTLASVADGQPWVVPLLHARDGDRLLFHGSTGAGALRHVAAGAPVAYCVTAIDALVVAHSAFEHSANYRSAVLRGTVTALSGDEKWDALNVFTDQILPGRSGEVRPMTNKELAATSVLALPILDGQWLMKVRDLPVGEAEEEHDAWTGLVGVRTEFGPVEASAEAAGRPVPESVRRRLG